MFLSGYLVTFPVLLKLVQIGARKGPNILLYFPQNKFTYLGQIELHFDLKKLISSTLSQSFPFHSSHSSRCSFLTPATHSRASKGGGELEPSIGSTSSLGRLRTHLPPLPLTASSPAAASSQQPVILTTATIPPLTTFQRRPL